VNEERGYEKVDPRGGRARLASSFWTAGSSSPEGFAGASVEEIAESAGYSTGALYSNFDSKEQLFLELLSARRSRVC